MYQYNKTEKQQEIITKFVEQNFNEFTYKEAEKEIFYDDSERLHPACYRYSKNDMYIKITWDSVEYNHQKIELPPVFISQLFSKLKMLQENHKHSEKYKSLDNFVKDLSNFIGVVQTR